MADKQKRGATGTGAGAEKKASGSRPGTESAMGEPTQAADARSAPARGENGGRGSRGTTGSGSRSAGSAGRTGRGASAAGAGDAALRKELRGFAASHRDGWNHDEWNQLLSQLQDRGFDTSRTDEIGQQLEKERLAVHLEGVQGVGPARVKKLQEEFGTLWELRNADPERIAAASGVKREVAERIRESVN